MKTVGDGAFRREDLNSRSNDMTYSGALSFLRRKYSRDLIGVDVAVTGIPYDCATSNRPGARFGPRGHQPLSLAHHRQGMEAPLHWLVRRFTNQLCIQLVDHLQGINRAYRAIPVDIQVGWRHQFPARGW